MHCCSFLLHRKNRVLTCAKIGQKCVLDEVFSSHKLCTSFLYNFICQLFVIALLLQFSDHLFAVWTLCYQHWWQ